MIQKLNASITKYRPYAFVVIILILIVLAVYGLYYINDKFILPNISAEGFQINWMTNRNFIKEGTSPYSDLATLRIQLYLFGHPATGDESPVRYAYPLTSLLLFWPFALTADPEIARALWLLLQELLLILTIFISFRIGLQKGKWYPIVFLFPLIIGFVFIVRSLFLGSFMILSILSTFLWLFFLIKKSDEAAGIFLAISTINLAVMLPVLIGIVVWAIFARRWKHLFWFGLTSGITSAFVALFAPRWIMEFFQSYIFGLTYPPYVSVIEILAKAVPAIAAPLAYVLLGGAALLFLIEVATLRKNELSIAWLMLLLLSISPLFGLPINPEGSLIYYPIFIITLLIWVSRGGWPLLFVVIAQLVLVGLPWLGMTAWRLGDFLVPQLNHWTIIMPFISVFILYWIRWWMVKPPHVFADIHTEL